MKPLDYDLNREFIVRHNKELRVLLTSVGRLLPEAGDIISVGHLPADHLAAINTYCGCIDFVVLEVAVLPGKADINGASADAARILVQPVSGSNFSARNLICQHIHQALAEKARLDEEPVGQNDDFRPIPFKMTHAVTKSHPLSASELTYIADNVGASQSPGTKLYRELGRSGEGFFGHGNPPVLAAGA